MDATLGNDTFISYRRSASGVLVLAIYHQLTALGIDVFHDITSIKAEQFGEKILSEISARPYFMPVLAPGTLERCISPDDWVRREIEHAIAYKCVLVPIHTPDFDFVDLECYLPDSAGAINVCGKIELPTKNIQYFKYAMQDIVENHLKPIGWEPKIQKTATSRVKTARVVPPPLTKEQIVAQKYFDRASSYANGSKDQIRCYSNAIHLNPEFAEAYNNRGAAYRLNGDYDKAISDYTVAIRIDPEIVQVYNNRGIALVNKSKLDDAIADYMTAIRLNPTYSETYNNLGNVYLLKSNWEFAIKNFREAIRCRHDNHEAYCNISFAYQANNELDSAFDAVMNAIEISPNFAEAYNQCGRVYEDKNDLGNAIICYTNAIKLRPDFVEAYLNRGRMLRDHGRLNNAIDDFTKVIEYSPNLDIVYLQRGTIYQLKGDNKKAAKDFLRYLELSPNTHEAQLLRPFVARYGQF